MKGGLQFQFVRIFFSGFEIINIEKRDVRQFLAISEEHLVLDNLIKWTQMMDSIDGLT